MKTPDKNPLSSVFFIVIIWLRENYKLMKLNDLSHFVKTNKHLPDVAPAAEMESEGINLSEMNALLLRKVEELTLYIIGQDEKMQFLEEKVNKLQK